MSKYKLNKWKLFKILGYIPLSIIYLLDYTFYYISLILKKNKLKNHRISLYFYYFLNKYLNKKLTLKINDKNIIFDVSEYGPFLRASSLLTKEPETIKWIDNFKNIKKDNVVFYDIGSNIGVYSLYANKLYNHKVFAFEAEIWNSKILNQNIYLNNSVNKIEAFNLAIGSKNCFGALNLNTFDAGGSIHTFKEDSKSTLYQNIFCVSLDSLIYEYNFDFPNFIKIDVDGNEYEIIKGLTKILKDDRLKSLLIEIDFSIKDSLKIIDIMKNNNFYVQEEGLSINNTKNLIFSRKNL